MLVNASLGIRNMDLFELTSSDRSRTVSQNILSHSIMELAHSHVYVPFHPLCSNQVKIQVSKETLGGIPIWIIIISILIGLLILALVIFALWKVILQFKSFSFCP